MLASIPASAPTVLAPILDTVPSLRLRKDIWTHFPVCLIKLPTNPEDHRDRYAIQWHQDNLDKWCQQIPNYQHIAHIRLMKALVSATDRWTVEAPRRPGDLCIIAMCFSEEAPTYETLPNLRAERMDLEVINDVKTYFPICWKTRKNQHILEFHNMHVRALAKKYSADELEIREITLSRLFPALKASGWTIAMPTKAFTN